MNQDTIEKIIEAVKSRPEVKLLYLFGSQAIGNTGPMRTP